MNAIEWGNRHRPEAMVSITLGVYPDRVEIVVRAEGAGFDPDSVPHAAQPDDPLGHVDIPGFARSEGRRLRPHDRAGHAGRVEA